MNKKYYNGFGLKVSNKYNTLSFKSKKIHLKN